MVEVVTLVVDRGGAVVVDMSQFPVKIAIVQRCAVPCVATQMAC